MAPPALLVRTARELWSCQWRQLMGGLGPADALGRYRRPQGAFSARPPLPEDADQTAAHVLIVGRSCPWAHRAWLVHSLRRLGDTIELVVVDPDPQAGRWRFAEPFEGCGTLAELYRRSQAPRGIRATVPLLWSRRLGRIVVAESARLIELLDLWPAAAAPQLAPPDRLEAIQAWRERLQGAVNDGVYRCGFATSQAAYDEAVAALFDTLDRLDERLATRRYLLGDRITEVDWRLFTTLVRFDPVYVGHFKANVRRIADYPNLGPYLRDLHQQPDVADTVRLDEIRIHYFTTHRQLNPSGIVPAGPALDWDRPHGREGVGA